MMPWSMLAELAAAGIIIAAVTRALFAVIYANGWDMPPDMQPMVRAERAEERRSLR